MKKKSRAIFVVLAMTALLSVTYFGVKKRPQPNRFNRSLFPDLFPTRYFSAERDLAVCRAISDNELQRLEKLISDIPDVNVTGKDGFNFLFWAWMTDNLDAFKMLLNAGADPDAKIKNDLRRDIGFFAMAGDSVLFATLTYRRGGDFLDAALKHTKDPNQVDAGGYNLIHRYFSVGASADVFNRLDSLIASGVDLHKPSPLNESVCEMSINSFFQKHSSARECIMLLEAGAPAESSGRSLYSMVRNVPDLIETKTWLESHGHGD